MKCVLAGCGSFLESTLVLSSVVVKLDTIRFSVAYKIQIILAAFCFHSQTIRGPVTIDTDWYIQRRFLEKLFERGVASTLVVSVRLH